MRWVEDAVEGELGKDIPEPTLFDRVSADARIANEEIFGPVLSVIRVGSLEEAIAVANGVDFVLPVRCSPRTFHEPFRSLEELDTGMTHVNNPTIGGEAHMPFGEFKATGVGPREMGPEAWKFYAEEKTVYINHAASARKSNIY